MEKVSEDHHLSKRIAEFMPEDHKSTVADVLEELFGLHPSSGTLVDPSSQTVLICREAAMSSWWDGAPTSSPAG